MIDYSFKLEQVANFAKALSNPARMSILQYLIIHPTCYFGDIESEIPLAKATVSQHLKALKDAGLIISETEGVKVKYCINPQNWLFAQMLFNDFLSQPFSKNQQVQAGADS